jgi:hypothetical protein
MDASPLIPRVFLEAVLAIIRTMVLRWSCFESTNDPDVESSSRVAPASFLCSQP